jgi:hypothetical protein
MIELDEECDNSACHTQAEGFDYAQESDCEEILPKDVRQQLCRFCRLRQDPTTVHDDIEQRANTDESESAGVNAGDTTASRGEESDTENDTDGHGQAEKTGGGGRGGSTSG